MAYTAHDWNTGEAITMEKMRHIEQGIEQAHNTISGLSNYSTRLDQIDGGQVFNDGSGKRLYEVVASAMSRANEALQKAYDAQQDTEDGTNAWNAIIGTINSVGESGQNLATIINNIKISANNANTSADEAKAWINAARSVNTVIRNGVSVVADSLAEKILDIDRKISDVQSTASSALTQISATNVEGLTMLERLTALDKNQDLAELDAKANVPDIFTEIKEARGTNSSGVPFVKLHTRLDRIDGGSAPERTMPSIITELSNAHRTENDTLNARFYSIDGGSAPSRTLPSIITEVNDAHRESVNGDTLNQRFNSIDSNIGTINNNLGYTNLSAASTVKDKVDAAISAAQTTLETRIDLIDNSSTGTVHSLDTRISTLEDNVNGAKVENGPQTLDARFDAVEGITTQLRTDVNTIASELAMVDTNTIVSNNTRVDQLESDLRTMAAELDMLDGTAIVDTNTRVDGITSEINAAHRTGLVDINDNPINDTLDNRFDAIEARATTLESTINHETTGLSATKAIADEALGKANNAATAESVSGLTTRVTNLEQQPKSATVVIENVTYNSSGVPTNIQDPSTDVDYLLKKDDKYYYWKYIKTGSNPDTYTWALISGGGGSGSGNTSGYDMTAEEYQTVVTNETYAENTDYYVTKTDGIHHYRYVMINNVLTEIEIGSVISKDNIKKYNIMRVDTTRINSETNQEEDVTYLNLYEFDYGADNTIIDTQSETMHLRAQVELPKGGSGAASTTVNNLIRIGAQTVQTIIGGTVLLRVFYSSWDGPQSNDGIYTLKAGSTTIATGTFNSGASDEVISGWTTGDGYYEFDVTNYCRVGTTNFTLSVNVNGTNLGKSWSVNVIDLHIESDAPDTLLLASSESYIFPYTPFGALQKTLHVVIDGDTTHEHTVSLVAATSGRANSYTITPEMILETGNALHGAHTIEMYLTANIGNTLQQTDSIIREYIWYDTTDTETPVILASPYNNQTINTSQYSTIEIPYQVYKKDASSIDVYYYLDNAVKAFDHITLEGTNAGTLSYLASVASSKNQSDEYIPHTITIKVDNISISVNLIVAPLDIDIAPVSGAIIDFDPTMLSNSSINRLPSWNVDGTTYNLTASENFNWSEDVSGGGYKEDVDGKCFVIKAGSYVDLNYKMFETKNSKNVFDNGAEIKVIFKAAAVRNADAIWFTNTGSYNDKTVGIQLGAHVGWLKTDKASDTSSEAADTIYDAWEENTVYQVGTIVRIGKTIYQCIESEDTNVPASLKDDEDAWDEYLKKWLKLGQIDTEILSTNSYLYLPYSEKDKIELDININKYESGSANNFIMSYEDGVPSKAYAYTYGISGDGLTHTNGIRIGSPDCDVYIYHLRIYNKALDTSEILQNFIADGKNIDEKVSRYNKNCIYWDATQEKYFTSPSGTAVLDPIKLAEQLPDVKILMLDTPRFTTGKKDFVKNSTLRCIHAKGGKVYASRGNADNWFFENGFHAGQGTTSDNYGQSARNVDFLFEVDATHWPTKEKNIKKAHTPSADYVSSVLVGENATKWDTNTETWVPTSIWDSEENKWVPNEDILSAEEIQNWTVSVPDKCIDWKGNECKIDLTANSIPNNYFNLKVNVASSENVNNALFQERYNEFLNSIYPSPAYKRSAKIKNDMEFVPAILFLRENDSTVDSQGNYTKHNEFNDTKWHFYALGNIGDSKKTDYTRAYNPKDINEFTVENSDNNTNNGQFQSGVFIYNDHRAIETDYSAWSNNIAYEQDAIVVYEGGLYQRTGETQAALGENETYNWIVADWTAVEYTGWTDTDPPYFAPRTNPNPMDYVYPITPSQWNIKFGDDYLNRKHQTLVTEKFDGDHSFEFRYACMGDYRDGDLINDTTGLAKAQEKTNHQKVLDFYEWLVTATEQEYQNQAANWFVPEAMEFFYAFTHYYTMMDNRAKNTFWHWGKQYISTNDANGSNYTTAASAAETAQTAYDEAAANLAEVESVQNPIIAQAEADIATADATLQEDPDNAEALAAKEQAIQDKDTATALVTAAQTTANTAKSQLNARILKRDELKFLYDNADCFIIDNTAAAINDGRRFDLWAYDMDTAAGIDNNGALVFPYGKEDEDYRVEGEASSGYAFNGAGSIFWRRLKNTFTDGIRTVMNNADVSCFNSENLIDQFDRFQSCFPEEIWRLDIERKYIRTFTGKSIDASITAGKQNPRFLTSMMQGRKKYQRRQWIRNQGIYFNSKYRLTDIIRNENTIEFNIITPTNASSLAVTPDYHLKLIPYQDMYLNVQVGNGNYQDQIRAKAGVEYTMDLAKNTSGTFQETRIYINGFNSISGISNLAPMYPYSFTLSALEHLKILNLGTDNAGYRNANFTSLPFEETTQLPLLETLNIKNCNSLTGTIKLNTANNIRTVEAVGSGIAGVILPDYTNIQTLHLPSTVSAISLYGARFLNDFYMKNISGTEDYSSLYTLHLYDSDYSSNIHWIDIALAMLEKESVQTNLQLLKLSTATIQNIATIEPISELKPIVEANEGIIDLSGTIHVTGSWSTIEKETYEALWHNNLQFDVSNDTQEYKTKVIYKTRGYLSDAGWVPEREIETKYITATQVIPDIYTGTTPAELPSRDPTIASIYQFGIVRQGTYVSYSGWTLDKDGDNPVSLNAQGWNNNNPYRAVANIQEITLYTFFNESPHQYTVNWYLKEGQLVKSIANQDYGGGDVLEAPTVKEVRALYDTVDVTFNPNNTVTYSIFDGWEKLPINISPTLEEARTSQYNIYGKWFTETKSIDEAAADGLFNDTTNPTLEQLLVFSRMDNTNRNNHPKSLTIVDKKKINYQMGFNGTKDTGTQIVYTNNAQIFNEDTSGHGIEFSNIIPFSTNNGFTLALDYQFDNTQTITTDAAVLVGCYDRVNGSVVGFALYNNTNSNYGPTGAVIGYGNMFSSEGHSAAVGNLTQRNMVVLRHPANTSELWIYSSKGNTSNSLETAITSTRITLDAQTLSSNATLCLGHLRADITTNSAFSTNEGINTIGAQGTIYWAKYWDEDLGAGECKQLAIWPHENMTAIITSIDRDTHEENSNIRPSIYLTNLTNSSHGLISSNRFSTASGTVEGWGSSLAKSICDNKIFSGLPIRMQSILANLRIGYLNYVAQYSTQTESVGYSLSNIQTSLGYVYIPSISSIANRSEYDNESIYERNGKTTGTLSYDLTPYTWYDDSASMEVYDYDYNIETRWRSAAANSAYYNLRFFNKPIRWGASSENKMRVFRVSRSTIGSQSLRTAISRLSELRPYDIAIVDGEAAYMYVTTNDLNTGLQAEAQGSSTSLFNTSVNQVTEGGWIKSHSYITRSANASNGQYNNFIYINALGSTITPDSSQNQPGTLSLDYAFTI